MPAGLAYVDGEAVPDTPQPMSVADAIYHTVHGYPGGVAALAARMGLPVGTLTHKANVNNATHHMRPDELVALQHMSGNVAVLQAMAAALGYTVQRATPDLSGGCPVQALVRFTTESADLVRAAGDPLAHMAANPDAAPSRNQVRRVQQHVEEVTACAAHLLGALSSRQRAAPKVDY